MRRIFWTGIPVMALAMCFGSSAFATAELELVSDSSTLFVADNGIISCSGSLAVCSAVTAAGDTNGSSEKIVASASNFNGWDITVTSGGSNSPACTGTNVVGCLGDTAITATASSSSTLGIYFADTGFVPMTGYSVSFATPTFTGVGATASQTAYNFSGSLPLGSGVFNPVPTSGQIGVTLTSTAAGLSALSTSGAGGAPNLELATILTAGPSGGNFQTTGNISPVPEPASGILLGSLLWCAGLLFRKKMKTRNQLSA